MRTGLTLLAALIAAPTLALGQDSGILVSDPAACAAMVDVDAELHLMRVIDSGAEALTHFGFYAEELDCWFNDPLTFDWSESSRMAVLGYCETSDMVQPEVFVVDMFSEVPGEVAVWMSGQQGPTVYRSCGG